MGALPGRRPNAGFLEQLAAAGVAAGRPVVFLCRSGVRSVAAAAGGDARRATARAYNVAEGFEGAAGRRRPPGSPRLAGRRTALAAVVTTRVPAPATGGPDTLAVRGGLDRSQRSTRRRRRCTSPRATSTTTAARGRGGVRRRRPTTTSTRATATRPCATFEERLRLIEGAEACFATATGMAAVFTSLAALLRAGDRVVGLARAVRLVLRHPRRAAAALGRRDRLRRRARPRAVGGGAVRRRPTAVFFESPSNPMQDARRRRGGLRARARRRRPGRRRQRVRHAACCSGRSSSAPTSSSTPRPSTSTARAGCSAARSSAPSEYVDGEPCRRSCGTPARR